MEQGLRKEVEETADGSLTLYIPDLDEHYHSVKGAVAESCHVYIEAALRYSKANPVHLLEVGFGTGLNAFLSLQDAEQSRRPVLYTSLELYPLAPEQAFLLDYPDRFSPEQTDWFRSLHLSPWEQEVNISSCFTLLKRQADLLSVKFDRSFDVVYFDAFAPEKQPELWEEAIFDKLFDRMNSGGVLTTYCAKGEVRRRLQRAGFAVERLAGPPEGKREILRAVKPE